MENNKTPSPVVEDGQDMQDGIQEKGKHG